MPAICEGTSIKTETDLFVKCKSAGNIHVWWFVALTFTTVQFSKPSWTTSEKNDQSSLDTAFFIMTMPDYTLWTTSFNFDK
jgi:hypothetical protein